MGGSQTESILQNWRYGQAQAERLVSAVLHLDGFEDVDPQHPLGGPDGLKDVLCRKAGVEWIAAAYFPPTIPSFREVKAKYRADAEGAKANGASGFAFFCNQPLTAKQRQELISISTAARNEVYHLERLVAILNAPKGCGIRLEYLRIPMTEEEQWSFWNQMNADIAQRVSEADRATQIELRALSEKVDFIARQTKAIHGNVRALPSSLASKTGFPHAGPPTAMLTPSLLQWIHRLVTIEVDYPDANRGRFRAVDVVVGSSGGGPQDVFVPTPHTAVEQEISALLKWWRDRHRALQGSEDTQVAAALAEFNHRFFVIHPFLDANGRVARQLLDQSARELLGRGLSGDFITPPSDYYEALRRADAGDCTALRDRILVSLL